ncbi:MAG: DUF542 domain-containing protein [Tissierellia bacterium]|nr:DUF542 domain-containing protein [Tissierellia bacterium]
MMIRKTMRIEEAMKEKPAIACLLEKEGVDFCCGGHQILEEALGEKGIDVDSFIKKLNEMEDTSEDLDWTSGIHMETEELIDFIVQRFHRKEEELLEEVDRYLRKILKVHYLRHGEELGEIYQTFLQLKGELNLHFAKEEKEVFPHIKKDPKKIQELEDEHEEAGKLLQQLEELSQGFTTPDDVCATYELAYEKLHELVDDIHLHIFLENSVLFQREDIHEKAY